MRAESEHWKAYLEQLTALPFLRSARLAPAARRNDSAHAAHAAVLSFKTPDGRSHALFMEHKERPLHGTAAHELLRQLQRRCTKTQRADLRWMVFAPYIDPSAAKALADAGVHYVDLRGNCHLALGKQYLAHVERPGAPAKPVTAKAWRAASYRVLFALLADPKNIVGATRELAARAGGVSPQTVADVRTKLQERGILLAARWAPGGYRRALDLWITGFSDTLAPSLHIGRYRAKERDPQQLEAMLAPKLGKLGRWAWGGGAACERLTHFYRGDTTVVYLEQPPAALSRDLGLVLDPSGPISVLRSPGPLALPAGHDPVVHPVLAYADLLREAEPRAGEAAAELYARYLAAEAESTT